MFKYNAVATDKGMKLTLTLDIGIEHTDEFPFKYLDEKNPKETIVEKFRQMEDMQLELAAKQIQRLKDERCQNSNANIVEKNTNEKLP